LPAVAATAVYFGSFDGNLYAMQRFDGEVLTRNSFNNPVESWPIVVKGDCFGPLCRYAVYLGHSDGNVYSFAAICCS
jgi:hypothetical protein